MISLSSQEEEEQGASLNVTPYRKPSQNMQSEHELGRTISRNLSTSVSASSCSEWKVVLSDAVSVTSEKGETLQLKKEVPLFECYSRLMVDTRLLRISFLRESSILHLELPNYFLLSLGFS